MKIKFKDLQKKRDVPTLDGEADYINEMVYFHEGDLKLSNLELSQEGLNKLYPDCFMLYVTGNLTVENNIDNSYGGAMLVVEGDVSAQNIFTEINEIYICGKANISNVVLAYGASGYLKFYKLNTKLLIHETHPVSCWNITCELEINDYDGQFDKKIYKYLIADVYDVEEDDDCDCDENEDYYEECMEDCLYITFDENKAIELIKDGKSILKEI